MPVDSGWADDKEGHAQRRRELFRAQRPSCTALVQGAIEGLGAAQLSQEWQHKTAPLLMTDSQSALALCKRRGAGRMKHIELKMPTVQEWLKTRRLRIHKVSTHDKPADEGHHLRETGQVWTCSEFAKIVLRRLEPSLTVTSVAPITETLSRDEHSQQLAESQTHRKRGNLRTTIETRIDNSPQPSTSSNVMNQPNADRQTDGRCAFARRNEQCFRGWRVRAMTSLTQHQTRILAAVNARKRLQATASLKPSWWTADMLGRAISERMRVIRLPSRRRKHNRSVVQRDQESHQKAY